MLVSVDDHVSLFDLHREEDPLVLTHRGDVVAVVEPFRDYEGRRGFDFVYPETFPPSLEDLPQCAAEALRIQLAA